MLAKRSCVHCAVVFKVADVLKVTCVKTEAAFSLQWHWVNIHTVHHSLENEIEICLSAPTKKKKTACAQQMLPFSDDETVFAECGQWRKWKKRRKKWEDKISLSSLVCVRQCLLTLSICQLPGSYFPLPKMHMCISRMVSYVHVKNKEPLFIIQSLLSLRDTVSVHPNMLF